MLAFFRLETKWCHFVSHAWKKNKRDFKVLFTVNLPLIFYDRKVTAGLLNEWLTIIRFGCLGNTFLVFFSVEALIGARNVNENIVERHYESRRPWVLFKYCVFPDIKRTLIYMFFTKRILISPTFFSSVPKGFLLFGKCTILRSAGAVRQKWADSFLSWVIRMVYSPTFGNWSVPIVKRKKQPRREVPEIRCEMVEGKCCRLLMGSASINR